MATHLVFVRIDNKVALENDGGCSSSRRARPASRPKLKAALLALLFAVGDLLGSTISLSEAVRAKPTVVVVAWDTLANRTHDSPAMAAGA